MSKSEFNARVGRAIKERIDTAAQDPTLFGVTIADPVLVHMCNLRKLLYLNLAPDTVAAIEYAIKVLANHTHNG